jgi:hypothetical protein
MSIPVVAQGIWESATISRLGGLPSVFERRTGSLVGAFQGVNPRFQGAVASVLGSNRLDALGEMLRPAQERWQRLMACTTRINLSTNRSYAVWDRARSVFVSSTRRSPPKLTGASASR